ncbi:DNA polymerase III subunit alpha [candidate division KSB1 bacterium]
MTIDELIDQAARHRMKALALTDINNVCGSVEFYEKAKLRGIKPIIGAEATLNDGSPIVLLVKDAEGYNNLCRLLTTVHLRDGHGKFFCKNSDLLQCKKGLILLSGGKRGKISMLVKDGRNADAAQLCRFYRETFGKDFYIEMNHLGSEDTLLNYRLADLAKNVRVPLVAANDVYLPDASRQPVRAVLRAVGKITTLKQLKDPGSDRQYLRSPAEMKILFKRYPDAVMNTSVITDKCRFEYSLGTPVFPDLELPEGETSYSLLWKAAFEGVKKRFKPLRKEAMSRLEYELNIINGKGFNEYFLIAKNIVDHCRKIGTPCVGRGSAADSLVSYALGITHVDPIRFDLYFERFLNPERSQPPDIDIDICWKKRDDILNYIYERYGHDRTAMICTYNTFKLRSAVRDVGKAFGLPEDEVNQLTKSLPHRPVGYLGHALEKIPECSDHPITSEFYKDILRTSVRIAGFPRHLSVHAGGLVISPGDITKYTALEVSGKGFVITHHDMHSIEKLGLVKMDILGVRGLSVIADCMEATGIKDMDEIPEGDKPTLKMIKSGKTVGCFQLESPAIRGTIKKMKIQNLDDIIDAIAIIRPGPAEGGMKDAFIRRRAGQEKIQYPHPLLEPILKETYGIVVYQEQVLKVASVIAGFSYSEADMLRRAMTKSRSPETLNPIRAKFIEGADRNGIREARAAEIWQFLENFVGYGFNKAHSSSYGLLAYQSAYLKRYHPVPFMTAVLNNGGGFYSLAEYIEEARRLGITIEPPDVNKAEHLFTCRGETINSGFYPVFDLTRQGIKRILEERKKEPYRDIYDFLGRAGLMEKEAVNLARAGALRSIHSSEPEAITIIKTFYRNRRNPRVTKRLMEELELPPYTMSQRIAAEMEILSFAVSDHPLALFPETAFDGSTISAEEIESNKDKTVSFIGWMVTSRRAPTRDGDYIKFATMEDRTGLVEVVLFPDTYRKYGRIMKGFGPFRITGTVQSRVPGEANLIADTVTKLQSKLLDKAENKILDRDIEDADFFDAA